MRRRPFVLLLPIFVACGAPTGDAAPTAALPSIAGLPALDVPLERTSRGFARVWEAAERASELPEPGGIEALPDWLDRMEELDRRSGSDALLCRADLSARERLVTLAIDAWMEDRIAETIERLRRESAAEELWRYARPHAVAARDGYERCARVADVDGSPSEWTIHCRRRAASLARLLADRPVPEARDVVDLPPPPPTCPERAIMGDPL